MRAMRALLLAACVLVGAFAGAHAARTPFKLGMLSQTARPMWFATPGVQGWEGFENDVWQQMCKAANLECELVLIPTIDDRITYLQQGLVDASMGRFSVTPERSTQVTFVHPYYYAAGAELFTIAANTALFPAGWNSISGQRICAQEGYYASSYIQQTYGATIVSLANVSAVINGVVGGQCIACVFDSSQVFDRVQPVSNVAPILAAPYAVALPLGNLTYYNALSGALTQLMQNGAKSTLLQDEAKWVTANNGTIVPALNSTVARISYFINSTSID